MSLIVKDADGLGYSRYKNSAPNYDHKKLWDEILIGRTIKSVTRMRTLGSHFDNVESITLDDGQHVVLHHKLNNGNSVLQISDGALPRLDADFSMYTGGTFVGWYLKCPETGRIAENCGVKPMPAWSQVMDMTRVHEFAVDMIERRVSTNLNSIVYEQRPIEFEHHGKPAIMRVFEASFVGGCAIPHVGDAYWNLKSPHELDPEDPLELAIMTRSSAKSNRRLSDLLTDAENLLLSKQPQANAFDGLALARAQYELTKASVAVLKHGHTEYSKKIDDFIASLLK